MDKKKDDVLITGIGLVSPYGDTLEDYFKGLTYRKEAKKRITVFNQGFPMEPTGVEISLPSHCNSPEKRLFYMGEKAIRSALTDWNGCLSGFGKIGLIVGSGLGLEDQLLHSSQGEQNQDYLSSMGEELAARVGLKCEVIYIGNACSAGSQAISYSADLLEQGCFDLIIAGGIDILSRIAYNGFLRLNAIDPEGCRPFDKDRKGITVGEGAAFCVMQKMSSLNKQAGKVYCTVAGSGVSGDAYHIVQMQQDGKQIIRAIREALTYADITKDDVDLIVAHGTGTVLNDFNEAKIISGFFEGRKENLWVTAPKGAIGHSGGASGLFGIMTAIGAIQYEEIPPVANLKNLDPEVNIPLVTNLSQPYKVKTALVHSFAFGGTNVVIALKRYNGEELYG